MREEETEELIWRNGSSLKILHGPKRGQYGETPAIILINPKYPHNVGSIIRAASCYGIKQVWYTGNRVTLDNPVDKKFRIPREERMRNYADVSLIQFDRPFDQFQPHVVPVAFEFKRNAENIHHFEHPENAVYVFGPEDGSIGGDILPLCHRFVIIPTKHCLNLASAVFTVLYDRSLKQELAK